MTINERSPRVLFAVLASLVVAATAIAFASGPAGQQAQAKPAKPAPPKNPLLKLAQPWPSPEEMAQQKAGAEARPLFAGTDPVAFTLAGDFKTINKDRDPASTKQYPAELRFVREGGRIDAIPVKLSARGHVRRMARTCDFVPLKLDFPKAQVKDTLFDGQNTLKLVVQCSGGGEFEQYIMREYLAYRISNLLTPRSVRARLAKVTYVDAAGKTAGIRYGIFLEDDGDVARRMLGRTVELPRVEFKDVDADVLETMMIFEYMVANTDFSLYALHNVIFVQTPDRKMYTVPYDLDMSGLVHPPYAIPDRRLPIKSVQERIYRGPCRTLEQVEPILANFNAKRESVMALPGLIPQMDKGSREDAKTFLEGFYGAIKNPKDVRRLFVDGCSKAPTM